MPKDEEIIFHLQRQHCRWTTVHLEDGSEVRVYNIAWGYDLGDDYAHVTTNISPRQEDTSEDFFYTSDIIEIIDEESGRTVFSKVQTPR